MLDIFLNNLNKFWKNFSTMTTRQFRITKIDVQAKSKFLVHLRTVVIHPILTIHHFISSRFEDIKT